MTKTEFISRENAAIILGSIVTPTFVGVTYQTAYVRGKTLRAAAPYDLEKVETGVFLLGQSYKDATEKAAKKAGVPAPEIAPRKWGVHVTQTLIEHKGSLYVQFRRLKNSRRKTQLKTSAGVEVGYKDVAQYFYDRPQSEGGVVFQDFKVENILNFTLKGVKYYVCNYTEYELVKLWPGGKPTSMDDIKEYESYLSNIGSGFDREDMV